MSLINQLTKRTLTIPSEQQHKNLFIMLAETLINELGHQNRHLDFLKVDTDKTDGTGFEDTV